MGISKGMPQRAMPGLSLNLRLCHGRRNGRSMLRQAGLFLSVSGGQGEEECRALTDKAFRPNAAAVPVNDALDGSKSNPSAFELFRAVEALERAKQIPCAFQIKTDAVVAHQES